MIKVNMGDIEVEGDVDLVMAETAVLLSSLRTTLCDMGDADSAEELINRAVELSKLSLSDLEERVKLADQEDEDGR